MEKTSLGRLGDMLKVPSLESFLGQLCIRWLIREKGEETLFEGPFRNPSINE